MARVLLDCVALAGGLLAGLLARGCLLAGILTGGGRLAVGILVGVLTGGGLLADRPLPGVSVDSCSVASGGGLEGASTYTSARVLAGLFALAGAFLAALVDVRAAAVELEPDDTAGSVSLEAELALLPRPIVTDPPL